MAHTGGGRPAWLDARLSMPQPPWPRQQRKTSGESRVDLPRNTPWGGGEGVRVTGDRAMRGPPTKKKSRGHGPPWPACYVPKTAVGPWGLRSTLARPTPPDKETAVAVAPSSATPSTVAHTTQSSERGGRSTRAPRQRQPPAAIGWRRIRPAPDRVHGPGGWIGPAEAPVSHSRPAGAPSRLTPEVRAARRVGMLARHGTSVPPTEGEALQGPRARQLHV